MDTNNVSSPEPEVLQLLGRIDGKLDQVIESAREHRDDDKRRFGEVYAKLSEHDQEIAKAHGAKGVIVWAVGLIAGGVGAVASFLLKAKGGG